MDADIEWPRDFCTQHPDASDLILRLLEPDLHLRLGCKGTAATAHDASSFASDTDAGFEAISQHKFFAGVEWDALLTQTALPPYTPKPLDASAFTLLDSDDSDIEEEQESIGMGAEDGAYVFNDF